MSSHNYYLQSFEISGLCSCKLSKFFGSIIIICYEYHSKYKTVYLKLLRNFIFTSKLWESVKTRVYVVKGGCEGDAALVTHM